MIDEYKDNQQTEAMMMLKMSSRSNSSKEQTYEYDSEKHHSSDDDDEDSTSKIQKQKSNNLEDTSFNIKSLQLNELREDHYHKKFPLRHEFIQEGNKVSMRLLLTQAFLYQFNHFLIVPVLFEFSSFLGHSPLDAGFLLAMTPLATSVYSAVMHYFNVKFRFKVQSSLAITMLIISNVLYLLAASYHSLWMLALSRFVFGLGGSKMSHRKYIANYVS